MKNSNTLIFHIILFIFSLPLNCNAQMPDCLENYEKALQLYNYGLADSALAVLNPCMSNKVLLSNLPKETAANFFRLAALSCIIKGDQGIAEDYVKKLVKYQPDYKNYFREDDLIEFRIMVNNAFSQPSSRLGLTGGTNIPFVALQKKYSVYDLWPEQDYLNESYGFQFGIAFEKTLSKNVAVEAGAGITQIRFKYTVTDILHNRYNYNQSYTFIEIPLLARYYFFYKKSVKPYLQGGVSGKISLNKIEKSDIYGRYWFTKSSNSDKILTTFPTDYEHFGLTLGGGVDYDLKNFNIRLDFRYNHSFKNSASYSKFDNFSGFSDLTNHEKFYYTDDINLISLKNVQISIGLLYNLSYKVF